MILDRKPLRADTLTALTHLAASILWYCFLARVPRHIFWRKITMPGISCDLTGAINTKLPATRQLSPRSLQLEQRGRSPHEYLRLAEGDVLHQLPVLQQDFGSLLGVPGWKVWPGELGDHLVPPGREVIRLL